MMSSMGGGCGGVGGMRWWERCVRLTVYLCCCPHRCSRGPPRPQALGPALCSSPVPTGSQLAPQPPARCCSSASSSRRQSAARLHPRAAATMRPVSGPRRVLMRETSHSKGGRGASHLAAGQLEQHVGEGIQVVAARELLLLMHKASLILRRPLARPKTAQR